MESYLSLNRIPSRKPTAKKNYKIRHFMGDFVNKEAGRRDETTLKQK